MGTWTTVNCWMVTQPKTAYLIGGRSGDVISLLPAFLEIYHRTGIKPVVCATPPYSDVLDGVSYVQSWPLTFDWKSCETARRSLESEGFKVICPTWYNDDPNIAPTYKETTSGKTELISHGVRWMVDAGRWPDVATSMYDILGFNRLEMQRLPLVFDQRDGAREGALIRTTCRGKKPVLLYNFTGVSSPFPAMPEVVNQLFSLQSQFQLIDLGKITAHRIYDLLGLYDIACGLVTSDTATLHLAPASPIPYIAFTADGWRGSVPRGNCKQEFKYIQSFTAGVQVTQIAARWESQGNGLPKITIRRTAALGDVLAATGIARKFKERGYHVTFQAYNLIHGMLQRSPYVDAFAEPEGHCDVNLDGAYERHHSRAVHSFSKIFSETASQQLGTRLSSPILPFNTSPSLMVSDNERKELLPKFKAHPKPWILVGPRSNNWANRTVPDQIWAGVPSLVKGTLFWTGQHGPAPAGYVDLACRDVDYLIRCLSMADLFVGVDSGPMHMAAALKVPVIAIMQASAPDLHLTDQRDFEAIMVPGLGCLNCQANECPVGDKKQPPCQQIPPQTIADAINRKLRQYQDTVSAIIPIYRPTYERLKKCIDHVIGQVDEVIVTAERGVELPNIRDNTGKVRFVVKGETKIGYGRNVNFGARHSFGQWLLFLNDDVFLEPNAVQKMKEVMAPDVGMVSNLLRYPDGTIYHAGKIRAPGQRGWGHINHRQRDMTYKEPVELENCCGACVLVRRKAHYEIDGFDEDFFVYAEDDAYALQMRHAGWKIMFTPYSIGTHLEHQSTQHLGAITESVNHANRIFHLKWHEYLDHNIERVPGNFDYLNK